MGNILYLRRMGWDFTPGINHDSDVGNFRVRTEGENIRGKNGKMYFLEFTRDGCSYSDLTLEQAIHEHNYSYTLENILKVVNEISADYYDEIIFID